ncbi:copper homeostasis protein CutC [Neorhizobium lilium]|uniref:PF03932 family protein CutC n=1 Tax=Neorhizobium lilium TaxID=2503024 RepID=A0A3S3S8E4_9HYPH|nr:copper homeostasis protein CutC [Neorhizobium lilium]RWX79386.1 copper homeostasis protein CutC [Neorhizobium lilium]
MAVVLEVCVDSAEGLAAAIEGGADRIELCACLAVGGLTPSPGLIALAAKAPIPVYAIIRPRAGNFFYDADSQAAMLADIDAVRAAGLAGVVIGASMADGRLDVPLLKQLKDHSEGLETTLHRAFDLVPDPFEALEQAVELGVERVLTSGLRPKAVDSLDLLQELVDRAGDRLSIMPGSGVNPWNVEQVLSRTGAREVHSSCRALVRGADAKAVAFGFEPAQDAQTSAAVVREMREILDRF